MHNAQEFLHALTIVFCVAAVTTVVFQRLRQPVVLGYLLAGVLVGPHVPFPLVADSAVVQTLSSIGVILLMFSLGLEFSLRRLIQVGPTAALTALVETSLMLWLGFTVVQLFGWTTMESLFAGAILAISSTTIVAKVFDEQRIGGRLRETVVGVLIVEDLIAIVLMASLTAIASGSGLEAGALVQTVGRLLAFLVGLVVIGLLVVPRAVRLINRLNRPETTIVSGIGLCFALALLAEAVGYSVALGAFIAGSLIAESGEAQQIDRMVEPVRDIFAAVFFVSVGMLIDPAQVALYWREILVLTVVVVCGKLFGVSLGSFLTGSQLRTSIQSGMSLAQIGEFSFIIAGLGLTLKVTGAFLYPVAIAVSALTTLLTPWLIRASGPVASVIDRVLPPSLQTFTVLYGSWIEGLRNASGKVGVMTAIRRRLFLLLVDASLMALVGFGFVAASNRLLFLATQMGIPETYAYPVLVGTAIALVAYFFHGVIRVGSKLGATLAELVLPAGKEGRTDLAAAPRRLLVVTFEMVIVVMIGAPLLVLASPFVSAARLGVLLALFVLVLGVAFWRNAVNLEGHVRAGAEVIVDALARQAHGKGRVAEGEELKQVEALLPGLGELYVVQLQPTASAVGKTLAELDLRALTGASILAITRQEGSVVVPEAQEILRAGDLLALTGKGEAIAAARELLGSDRSG